MEAPETDHGDGGTAEIPADDQPEAASASEPSAPEPDPLSDDDTIDIARADRPSAEIEPAEEPSSDPTTSGNPAEPAGRDDDPPNRVSQVLDKSEVWSVVRQIGMYAAGTLGLMYIGSVVLGPHPVRTVFGPTAARTVDTYVLGYIPGLGSDLDTAAVDANAESIFDAVAVTGWEPDLEPGNVETDDRARRLRTYKWGEATMTVEVYEHDSPAAARRRVRQTEPPERAIRIASKAVVMRVADEKNTIRLEPVYETLENYRSLLARD
jgi:hypothetical protein